MLANSIREPLLLPPGGSSSCQLACIRRLAAGGYSPQHRPIAAHLKRTRRYLRPE